ncbi:MAG: hypothetical protein P1Q69_11010 [Candidatus Thorarchaeota archaeon]|nr:hypothetical protein [Candidatus Thorarchaeota archaeon]
MTSPTINHPLDIAYSEGTTGHEIVWTHSDSYPSYYELYINDVLDTSGEWDSSMPSIVVDVDGLSPATYNYTLVVYDQSGNPVQDDVLVFVLSTTDTTTTTTSTTADTNTIIPPGDIMIIITIIITIGSLVVIVSIAVLVMKSRK